ncbi:MAG: tyrosine-protein phosphatase, partial [Planctomycetia bacterium]|nr:tyrosine-protein phosphatase [Planctomycetia bacterium]
PIVTASGTFKTRGDMPRTILVDGIHNVRDLGGFMTASGQRVRQGCLFRGSEMNGSHGIQISEAGIRTMTEELAIRTDLDFRSRKEALEITESPLGEGVNLVYQPIGSYLWAFDHPESYRTVFSLLADEKNYPIYFHCWGGADRTGTVAFFVNALLGVAEEDLFRDFEFTSFSVFGVRNRHAGDSLSISETYEKLKTYPGATLAEKTENFLLSIGVTAEEIQALRRNLLEEE